MKKPRATLARTARVLQLGAGLTGSYLAYQLQRPFLDDDQRAARRQSLGEQSARRVREQLANLRGPIMKIGQALSMQSHALGPEWIEELSALQMQAPPMHEALMRAQFKAAFGRRPEDVFRSFEPAPFAAASLGQVHRATLRTGEDVIVKIQYPAIEEAIANDFRLLRTAGLPVRLTGHLQDSVIREAERGILEEADYVHEADNIEFCQAQLRPLAFVRVPKVYRELSCRQVLTMSRVPGLRLQEFLKTDPSQALRDEIGAGLTRLFFFQLFRVHALHADPHPGNYLFNDDGSIGLVDFGCVKRLKPEVVRCYAQFWARDWVHDPGLYREIVQVLFGRANAARDPKIRRGMEEIRRFYDEFHPLGEHAELLNLADARFMEALTRLASTLVQKRFLSADFLFLSRTEAGMCNLLHNLRARVATTKIVRDYLPSGLTPQRITKRQ